MKQLLSGKKIIKTFGVGEEKHRVLNEVSVTIGSGEFVSIMGPSGSGKSTLLYALSGMDGIDSGEVAFEGRRLSGLSDDALSDLRRNRMGFVFQQPTLLKNLNILDNIILPQTRDRKRNVKQLTAKARLLMRQMGIEDLEERDITQASGGQLQRAGICRALMGEPGIVFGDEPTGALDSKSSRLLLERLEVLNRERGATILMVTHDAFTASCCRRVVFLRDGKIFAQLERDGGDRRALFQQIIRVVTQLGGEMEDVL